MASSATDICNLALDLLSSNTIQNVVDPSNATEEILNRWYNKSRRKVLREHPWNFATKRAVLAASATDPAFGFTYQYPLPSDFIRLMTLEDGNGDWISAEYYQIENNAILYDGTTLRLRYIYDFTSVPRMDDLFIDWLVYEIALGISYKQTGSNSDIERITKLRDMTASKAKAIDGQEHPPLRVERSKIITARRVGSRRTDIIE